MNTAQNAKNLDSMPTNSPMNQTVSSTTISQREIPSQIGTGLSGRGLEMLRSLVQPTGNPLDARTLNSKILASLKQDFGSHLVTKDRVNGEYEVIGTDVTLSVAASENWIKALEYYNRPAKGEDVAMEVTRLRTLTAKRKEGEFDLELSIGALTEELCIFPSDIVRTACREWARNNKFFPVLKEILDECKNLVSMRASALAQMRNYKAIEHTVPEEAYIPPTEEEKQKVRNLVDQAMKDLSASSAIKFGTQHTTGATS